MQVVEFLLLAYFGYVSLYSFVLSTAGLFYRPVSAPKAEQLSRIAVLIPAYKEDRVIGLVAREALKQSYAQHRYDVVIIADSLQQNTLEDLRQLPVKVIEVSFERSTKVKALNRALEVLGDQYDCALVLDADNIMETDFITRMNDLFVMGYPAIQGRRTPKNDDTPVALLDGLSETINNFIYRQGNAVLGLSSPLNGSGMMFHYATFKNIMLGMESIGGFDRELELKLLQRGMPVLFAGDAIVFDEKVANPEVFEHQRKRWLSSHFFYLRRYFAEGWRRLFRGEFDFFNSAVLRNLQLPRLLNLGLLTFVAVVAVIGQDFFSVHPLIWASLLAMNVLAILFAIPRRFYGRRLLMSVLLLPRLFIRMFLLLFRLKGANKRFLHTPHVTVKVEK